MDIEKKELKVQSVPATKIYEKEIEFDGTLPDYLPNIERPIRVNARTGAYSITYEADKAIIKGTVSYDLLYESDYKGKLKTYSFTGEYAQKTEIKNNDNINISVNIVMPSSVCKMLNPRKFLIRTHVICELSTVTESSYDILAPAQESCCIKTKSIASANTKFYDAKEFLITETFGVGEQGGIIGDIITASCTPASAGCVCSNGFVTVSGDVNVTVIYEQDGEGTPICKAVKSLPYSFIVDADAAAEGGSASAAVTVSFFSADSGIDAYGDTKNINLNCKIGIALTVMNETYDAVVTDIFMPGSEATLSTAKITYASTGSFDKVPFIIDHISENRDGFTEILDYSGVLKIADRRRDGESTFVQAVLTVYILGKTPEGVYSGEASAVFSEAIPSGSITGLNAEISDLSVSLYQGSISIKSKGSFDFYCSVSEEVEAVSNMIIGAKKERDYPVTIFFPTADDTAWDIAKSCGISVDKLKADNADAFKGDSAVAGGRILIMK